MAISWCDYHIDDDLSVNQQRESLNPQEWEQKASRVDFGILYQLIKAAIFLDLTTLLGCCCKKAAEMIDENCLYSLSGLPDEVQLQIANQIKPYMLPKAAKTGIVPITPKLEKRVQHAQVWATVLPPNDLSLYGEDFSGERK